MRFSQFGYALLAGAVVSTGAAQAACNLELTASLPLKIENGRMFIPGKIGERPIEYMVDMGAPTLLLQAGESEYGVTPFHGMLTARAIMGDMEKQATLGPDAEHNVALAVDYLPIRVARDGSLPNFGPPLAMATLGMDFFALYDVEIDPAHHTVKLFRPTGCESAKLAYWTKRYQAADMVANITRPLNIEPYTVYNFPHINIRVSVNGHDMLAAIDPGYKDSSLSLTAAHTAGIDIDAAPPTESVPDVFDGYSSPARMATFDSIALGPETVAPAKLRIHSFNPPAGAAPARTGSFLTRQRELGQDMVLGADFFLSHRVLISYSQNKVYFSPIEGQTYLGGTPSLPAETVAN